MSKKVFAFCAVLALALVASPAVMAQTDAGENQSPAELKGAEAFLNGNFELNGMRAFIDPETGEVRQPTADEAAALRELVFQRFQLQSRMPLERQLVNGGSYVQLDPSLHDAVTVHVTADGTLHMNCTNANHNVQAPSEAPAREEM